MYMKTLRHKKSLTSILAMLIALVLIAGSTFAFIVVGDSGGDEAIMVPFGNKYDFESHLWPNWDSDGTYLKDRFDLEDLGPADAAFFDYYLLQDGSQIGYCGLLDPVEYDVLDEDYGYFQNWGNKPICVKVVVNADIYVWDEDDEDYLAVDDPEYYAGLSIVIADIPENEDWFTAGGVILFDGDDYYIILPEGTDKISVTTKAGETKTVYDGPKLYAGIVITGREGADESEGYVAASTAHIGTQATYPAMNDWFDYFDAFMNPLTAYEGTYSLPMSIDIF